MNIDLIRKRFAGRFGGEGELYTSPGRINLIGEHTDYNGGFVFPGAIDKGMVAEIRPNGTDRVRAVAVDLDDYAEFGLGEQDAPSQGWARYIFGVCREIQKRGGRIAGFDAAFSGDVPLGAGMSSSAALESTFANALDELFSLGIDRFELARIGQATEHNYCGVNCGIMDQFASVFGKAGHLMRLDCRSMEFRYFPFDPEAHGSTRPSSTSWSTRPTTNAASRASASWRSSAGATPRSVICAMPTWICSVRRHPTSLRRICGGHVSS